MHTKWHPFVPSLWTQVQKITFYMENSLLANCKLLPSLVDSLLEVHGTWLRLLNFLCSCSVNSVDYGIIRTPITCIVTIETKTFCYTSSREKGGLLVHSNSPVPLWIGWVLLEKFCFNLNYENVIKLRWLLAQQKSARATYNQLNEV